MVGLAKAMLRPVRYATFEFSVAHTFVPPARHTRDLSLSCTQRKVHSCIRNNSMHPALCTQISSKECNQCSDHGSGARLPHIAVRAVCKQFTLIEMCKVSMEGAL